MVSQERLGTNEGQALTLAASRTRLLVTQPLVIAVWTLRHAVTQVVRVYTHRGPVAAVVAGTRDVLTVLFILAVDAVVITVTACENRNAVLHGVPT